MLPQDPKVVNGRGQAPYTAGSMILVAVLYGFVLLTVDGKSLDDERYNDFILKNLPTLLEEIKVTIKIISFRRRP